MHERLLGLLACPGCRSASLEHHAFDLSNGYVLCRDCRRVYFEIDGIPRMLTEDYADLLDLSFADRSDVPESHRDHLMKWRERVGSHSSSARARWGIEDASYWDNEVYASPELVKIGRSRPDAGNRMWPREQFIFRHVRERAPGKVVLDMGCGVSQAVRVLADPAKLGYHYVGCDLSLNALKANARTMQGDFIQASATDPPFRDGSAAAVLMLGVLHHLPDQDRTVATLLALLEPGGIIAFHEVMKRRAKPRARAGESAHNDSVDAAALLRVLGQDQLLVVKRENSRLRWVLTKLLDEPMRTRPWLTRAVLAIDDAFNATIGKAIPALGPSAIIAVAEVRYSRTEQAGTRSPGLIPVTRRPTASAVPDRE